MTKNKPQTTELNIDFDVVHEKVGKKEMVVSKIIPTKKKFKKINRNNTLVQLTELLKDYKNVEIVKLKKGKNIKVVLIIK